MFLSLTVFFVLPVVGMIVYVTAPSLNYISLRFTTLCHKTFTSVSTLIPFKIKLIGVTLEIPRDWVVFINLFLMFLNLKEACNMEKQTGNPTPIIITIIEPKTEPMAYTHITIITRTVFGCLSFICLISSFLDWKYNNIPIKMPIVVTPKATFWGCMIITVENMKIDVRK